MEPGGVLLFMCDQNGRDLPDDNEAYTDEHGTLRHPLDDGKPHYFLVLTKNGEGLHKDWSKMDQCEETDYLQMIKLCMAVPIDDNYPLNEIVYSFEAEDYRENAYNPDTKREIQKFSARPNAVLCNKICQVNVSKCLSKRVMFYISPEAYGRIIEKVAVSLERGRKHLSGHLSSQTLKK